jgi:hypothetical protein
MPRWAFCFNDLPRGLADDDANNFIPALDLHGMYSEMENQRAWRLAFSETSTLIHWLRRIRVRRVPNIFSGRMRILWVVGAHGSSSKHDRTIWLYQISAYPVTIAHCSLCLLEVSNRYLAANPLRTIFQPFRSTATHTHSDG